MPLERFEMQASFEGLIQLLAKNLYPEPDVFVRELIQNAHDSIQLRRGADSESAPGVSSASAPVVSSSTDREAGPAEAGRIDVRVDPGRSVIVFEDDGLGMDRADVKRFLSVIGSTGTGSARERLQALDREAAGRLIGTFGIGLLSAFVVADRIVVRTRKVGASEALVWENSGTTECTLSPGERARPGTEVTVHVAPSHSFMLDPERIRKTIVLYCDFIPFPITLNGQGPVNATEAPWHREWSSEEERDDAYHAFLRRRYPDNPLEVIPIALEDPVRARGALFITDGRIPDINSAGVVDIFVRRMFVRQADTELLPEWAKFVRGVIDSPDLQPTAARDNIQRGDEAYRSLHRRLGELIMERLVHLAGHHPDRFREINAWHHYHLKGMALFDDEFFGLTRELLLFDTNRGMKPLQECLAGGSGEQGGGGLALYYFTDAEAAQQYYRLANARGWIVVNAGHLFEADLIAKYAETNQPQVRTVRLDTSDGAGLLQAAPADAREIFRGLEMDVEAALCRGGVGHVSVQTRCFEPSSLPAALFMSPETRAETALDQVVRQQWTVPSLEQVTREVVRQRERRPLRLVLNANHELIRRLGETDRADQDLDHVLVGLFLSACLYVRNLLTDRVAGLLHGHLTGLLESAVQHSAFAGISFPAPGGPERTN